MACKNNVQPKNLKIDFTIENVITELKLSLTQSFCSDLVRFSTSMTAYKEQKYLTWGR